MDFSKIGIYECGGERVRLRPIEVESRFNEPLTIKAIVMGINQESNARKKNIIEKVIFNAPATIVIWTDGTKTVVKCQEGDTYDREKGLALCIAKKYLGNKGNFNEIFKKWIPEEPTEVKEKEDYQIGRMRLELTGFCDGQIGDCGECDLRGFCLKNSYDFLGSYHGEYILSDDKVREAYNIAFEKNEK